MPPPPLDPEDGHARVHLGSLSALPPLMLFAPSVASALHTSLGFTRPPHTWTTAAIIATEDAKTSKQSVSSAPGTIAGAAITSESLSAHTLVDHTDVWDDTWLSTKRARARGCSNLLPPTRRVL